MIVAVFRDKNDLLSMFEDEKGIVYDAQHLNEYLVAEINKLSMNDNIISQIKALFAGVEKYALKRTSELYDEEVWEVYNSLGTTAIQVTLTDSSVKAQLV